MRKVQSLEGFIFSRGNSGSPVICKSTGKVMAVLSNKEGHNLAYAIPIMYLADIWKDIPSQLIKSSTHQEPMTSPIEETLNNLTLSLVKDGWIGKRAYNKVKAFQSKNNFFKEIIFKNNPIKPLTIVAKIKSVFLTILGTVTLAMLGYWGFTSFLLLNYKVTEIRQGHTLNVRSGFNKNHKIIAELPYHATNIMVHECKLNQLGKKWCHIQYRNTQGWVRSKYISIEKITLK